jgi:putative endonuclease
MTSEKPLNDSPYNRVQGLNYKSRNSVTSACSDVILRSSATKNLLSFLRLYLIDRRDRAGYLKQYYVYILASRSRNLYVGVTNDLQRRVYEHKQKLVSGFTTKYNINRLVYFEATEDVHTAISREKQIKGWLRKRKLALIGSRNPTWVDLSDSWT